VDTARIILLLDEDGQSAEDIQRFLKVSAFTFSVTHTADVEEGINYLKNRRPDIILLDSQIMRRGNFELFKEQSKRQNIPVILLGDLNSSEARRETELAGAADYLAKDKINLFQLQKAILNTLKMNETQASLDKSSARFNLAQDTWQHIIERSNIGVLVVNRANSILYASKIAYAILISNDELQDKLNSHLNYRQLEYEELLEIKGRNTGVRIKISEVDWFGEKANLFILDKLEVAEPEIDLLSREPLQSLLNSLSQAVLLTRDMLVVYANNSALKKLNLRRTEIEQVAITDIFEDIQDLKSDNSIKQLLNGHETVLSLKQADNTLKQVNAFVRPLTMGGVFYQMLSFEVAAAHTSTPEKGETGQYNTHSILELASHDLREPVRTILNYIQLVADNLQKEKYDIASEYTGYARAAADRMETLLSDLKTYISLNDYKYNPAKISTKLVVNDVLKQLKGKIDKSKAEINVADLPEIRADRELVERVFYHLIENAIKFQHKLRAPVIDIGFDKYDGKILFCVRDNGIGISKKYQDKIFELFERLNRVDEYAGNGLGLAVCKKIVEIHGGKIWVESLPGFGSSFYFTLS
jgi:signal transduction histidine kinase/DNA-binding response OmpR family regulator